MWSSWLLIVQTKHWSKVVGVCEVPKRENSIEVIAPKGENPNKRKGNNKSRKLLTDIKNGSIYFFNNIKSNRKYCWKVFIILKIANLSKQSPKTLPIDLYTILNLHWREIYDNLIKF